LGLFQRSRVGAAELELRGLEGGVLGSGNVATRRALAGGNVLGGGARAVSGVAERLVNVNEGILDSDLIEEIVVHESGHHTVNLVFEPV
jgi:hypothetical protein